ncbi:ABC transporter permease [Falsarthrobacter nasiphocae]|uniref:ABC transport system permease protein n=1 Tax=Falsarthrobacter nasiphocae TaxID=189863 RepID=A0AAE3YDP8_9MICC|nr:ABC transporter permease [Falsarthrobacter nasiphocae]MDR6891963.1 putative ABC transport system permease protein [Falsarthrobacter nasiphocae]
MLREAWINVWRRPGRTVFSVLTVLIGTATLVTMLAVTRGSAHRSAEHLAGLSSGSLIVSVPGHLGGWEEDESRAVGRLRQLPGLRAAGTYMPMFEGQRRDVSTQTSQGQTGHIVTSAEGVQARGGRLVAGGWPSTASLRADGRQVLVGAGAARTLGVWPEPGRNRLLAEGRWVTVTGVVEGRGEAALLGGSVLWPVGSEIMADVTTDRPLLIAADDDGPADHDLAVSAWPYEPEAARVTRPVSASSLKAKLLGESRDMVLITVLVLCVSSAVSVYSTMQSAVWERRRLIGLDRALGASRWRVGRLFLAESAITGGLGTVLGLGVGLLAGELVALVQGWPHLQPWWIALLPLAGAGLGAVSGMLPAVASTRVDPARLLRE